MQPSRSVVEHLAHVWSAAQPTPSRLASGGQQLSYICVWDMHIVSLGSNNMWCSRRASSADGRLFRVRNVFLSHTLSYVGDVVHRLCHQRSVASRLHCYAAFSESCFDWYCLDRYHYTILVCAVTGQQGMYTY